jgi:hypothetical protein
MTAPPVYPETICSGRSHGVRKNGDTVLIPGREAISQSSFTSPLLLS